ncbi:dihydroorotase [Lederbergia citrea]|uniref:Amidohydrolase family protein n=1 Tax=Lederbergia citrea TaxID=2833581 RepID=A0A942Z4X8_9BACI|nr:amidohydrolase family protein [Lederbergia citrea]MBS4178840.1 amidohydrolase family protein [Lederbergia citrea]MBS4224144.1 amidohydrolase family protein [Lederbergia citrea]
MEISHDLLIKGNVVFPDRIAYDATIAVKDGKISHISETNNGLLGKETIDATGKYILPGAIDAHVHCFSSLEEGFTNAGYSAAAGGVTTIIEMPYDATGMVSTEQLFLDKIARLERESVVDIALLATISPKDGLDEIAKLAEAGACGFKVSMFNTDSFRFPRIDEGQLLDAFSVIAETGCPVGVHAENDDIVKRYIRKYEDQGIADPRAHVYSRPKVAESVAALTAMELAYYTGVKLHLYHSTFQRVFDFADYYRSQGARITAETCTHYLTLSEDDMVELGARGKINPPLRTKQDVTDLWNLIACGKIDMVTSDHAPWTLDRKENIDIFQNASGAPGVETLLPIMYSEGVATGKITILDLVRVLAENPAATFGLGNCKGRIGVGMDADIVIFDPQKSYMLDEQSLHSSAKWSPYHNRKIHGKIINTFVRGRKVYNGDGEVVGKAGDGSFVKPQHRDVKHDQFI